MQTKQLPLKVGLVLTILTLPAICGRAMAGDLTPYKGHEVGIVTKGAFQFPFAQESVVAEGEATHLGHYTLTGDFVVNVTTASSTGVYILTAANGDTLYLDQEGHADPTDLTRTVAHFTITGGTGRFEGASGSFTTTNTFDFAVGLPITDNPYVGVTDGIISTPGSNKK